MIKKTVSSSDLEHTYKLPGNCQMHAEVYYHQTLALRPTVHLPHQPELLTEDTHYLSYTNN